MSLVSYLASAKMHGNSLKTILHAPMSFFDTTPLGMVAISLEYSLIADCIFLGRILGVFGKDMDSEWSLNLVQ